jgi:hypothetical protein
MESYIVIDVHTNHIYYIVGFHKMDPIVLIETPIEMIWS